MGTPVLHRNLCSAEVGSEQGSGYTGAEGFAALEGAPCRVRLGTRFEDSPVTPPASVFPADSHPLPARKTLQFISCMSCVRPA